MTEDEITDLLNTTLGYTLTDDELKYIARVGKACQASYLIEDLHITISKRLKTSEYTHKMNRVNISEKVWTKKNRDDRRELLRRIICEVVDRKLHADKAGGWEYHSLIREVERRCG